MPILVCRCESCGAQFDYLSLGVADVPECPECRSRSVARLLAPFAVGQASVPAGCLDCGQAGAGTCPGACPRALAGA